MMKIITGYFEIYDLTMAIYFSFNTDVTRVLKILGVEYTPSKEMLSFRDKLLKSLDWSTRIYTTFMNELGVIAPILFPVRAKMVDKTIVKIEDSLDFNDETLKIIRERFIQVLSVRRLKISPDDVKKMIEEKPGELTRRVEEIEGISRDSKWFINQLLFFPRTALDFLESNTWKMLKIYEESGLRSVNFSEIGKFMKSYQSEMINNSIRNYFEYYDIHPDESKPLYVALQNSVPHTNSGLMTYPSFHLLIMGLGEITKDFSESIPLEDRVRNVLKVIGDETRFKIIQYLFDKPATQKELAEVTGLSKSTISYHISLLFKASLVDIDVFNNIVMLRRETIKKLVKNLKSILNLR